MKILYRLVLGYLGVALLAGVTDFVSIHAYKTIDRDFDLIADRSVPEIEALENIKFSGLRVVSSTSEYGFLQSERGDYQPNADLSNEEKISQAGVADYYRDLTNYKALLDNAPAPEPPALRRYDVIAAAGKDLLNLSDDLMTLKKNGTRGAEVIEKKEEFEVAEHRFLSAIDFALKAKRNELLEAQLGAKSTIQSFSRITLIIDVFSLFAAVGIGFAVSRSLAQRIHRLQQASVAVGQGNLEVQLDTSTTDEIGALARSFNRMTGNLKTARHELLAAQHFTDNVINSMSDLVLVTNADAHITRINTATETLLGYAGSELLGRSIDDLFIKKRPPQEVAESDNPAAEPLDNDERVVLTKSGREIPVSFVTAPLCDLQGSMQGSVCVGRDIRERKQAEEKLRTYAAKLQLSNRELQDFAFVASHDLQEPLRKVQAFGDRLKLKCQAALGADGLNYLERMQSAARRMHILINDLLTFSRVTTKAQPFVSCNLAQVTQEVLSDLEVRIEQTGACVEVADLPVIEADPLQMRQLLQNLIGNALKFTHQDIVPRVKISGQPVTYLLDGHGISRAGNFCQISIADNGIGFEEKYLDRIFTVFQRLHGRSEYDGSGVGLAVCRKIVERHSGLITARSAPGAGATFIATLPLRQNGGEKQS